MMNSLTLIPPWDSLTLGIGGLIIGCLAGILGIGGGVLLVPMMVALGFTAIESVATSSFVMLLISVSGSLQNWRMGKLSFQKIIVLGLPSLLTAQLGVYLLGYIPSYVLMVACGVLLLANILLIKLRKNLSQVENIQQQPKFPWLLNLGRIFTGSVAGLLAGLLGISGGVVIVPLQIILLGEPMEIAAPTSLGVVVLSVLSAFGTHAVEGNVLYSVGILLGITGAIGAQIGTRILPKIPAFFANLTSGIPKSIQE